MYFIINRKRKKIYLEKCVVNGVFLGLLFCFLQFLPQPGFAASTVGTSLFRQIGSGAPTSYGDYISSSGGLNTRYYYYIEVPSGLSQLVVDIFDADVGAGATNQHDWLSGSWDTSCRYRLYNPGGTRVADVTYNNTQAAANNAWVNLYTSASPAAGHWELRVEMYSSVTNGDDCNGYGIRAHDGNSGSGGTEINIYALSFVPLGSLGTGTTMTTTLYPFVTSGCTADWNDWDGDNAPPTYLCTVSDTSRTGNTSGSFYGSQSTVWLNTPITGFDSDKLSSDNGIWSATISYTDTGANANFGVFYAGNSSAANPPPTAQPQANTFRIYLPTDAGGAPRKPFVTQKISYVSGSNPAAAGQTTRVRIEIVVFNPAVQPITFSAANLVTANVPGGGVVYAGNAQVSQGSITAQPGVGGTGNITWNPGAVAGTVPGNNTNYATLYYQVDVTPASAGQRLPLTGVGASGTTARYVDETGNTTQALATYTYGPLCELAVTEGGGGQGPIPTLVTISSFAAVMEGGQTIVQWKTASEIGTVGFYLWRKDRETGEYQPVNASFLPGLVSSPQGGIYRLVDPTAMYGETYEYKLVEVEASGRSRTYGPFFVTVGDRKPDMQPGEEIGKKCGQPVPADIPGYSRMPFAPVARTIARVQERRLEMQNAGHLSLLPQRSRAKIAIKDRGLYYLSASQIAETLGVSLPQAESMILSQNLQLTNQGQQVAWLADKVRPGVYFYGEGITSLYTNENIYWLEQGRGLSLPLVNGGSPAVADVNQTFRETVHAEENHYALAALFTDPGSDIFLWDYVIAGSGGKFFNIYTSGAADSGTATLTVHLKGATDTPAYYDHHTKVFLNGVVIGGSWWSGTENHSFSATFNQSLLREGENGVAITGILDTQAPYSIFYVDSFDLSYQKYYRAVNNSLLCQGDDNQAITVSGFMDSNIMVWDVTNPREPGLVTGTTIDLLNRIAFIPSSPQSRYLVASLSAARPPASLAAGMPSSLKQNWNSADYIIIAPEILKEAARELADYHQGKGLTTMIVSLEDIYDEFNWGISSPWAIKNFLTYAYQYWRGNKPRYVVLVGKGTYDYKNCLGYDDNLVPPLLASTPDGLFAADKLYGDVVGNDGVPEIAVGRLPVVSVEELQTVIRKIESYGNAGGEWARRAFLISDNRDSSGDFQQDNDSMASLISGYSVDRAYLPDHFKTDETRRKIMEGLNAGAALVNYVGHAGLDQLAEENLLHVDDLPSIQNGDRLPIMILLSCVVGRFEIPGNETLSESLVLKGDGGAVAVLAPTGASPNPLSTLLGQELYKAVFRDGEKNLGKAWLKAMEKYVALGGDRYLLNIFNLIGDPALEFK